MSGNIFPNLKTSNLIRIIIQISCLPPKRAFSCCIMLTQRHKLHISICFSFLFQSINQTLSSTSSPPNTCRFSLHHTIWISFLSNNTDIVIYHLTSKAPPICTIFRLLDSLPHIHLYLSSCLPPNLIKDYNMSLCHLFYRILFCFI